MRTAVRVLAVMLIVAACTPFGGAPTPSIVPSPGGGDELSLPHLEFALLERLGDLWYCDPDEYPVPRDDEPALARDRLPEIERDEDAMGAILDWLGMDAAPTYTGDQQLAIYRAWKRLNAIELTEAGSDRFRFDILTRSNDTPEGGIRTTGIIDRAGSIEIEEQMPAGEPACPICLAGGTRIGTPDGRIPIERLRVGDRVWTTDRAGRRIAVRIVAAGNTAVPATHRVVHLVLADGRTVTASPGHPLADGRRLAGLRVGDPVDGSPVVGATLERYDGPRTYDILPAGPTGTYWADGVLLGSTLAG